MTKRETNRMTKRPVKRERTSTRRRGQKLKLAERTRIMDGWLAVFAQSANMMLACREVGIDRQSVYRWLHENVDGFAARYREAEEDYNDRIDAEIDRRAIQGIEKPVTVAGEREIIREYSDTLLIFRAKARMPHKYRERWEGEVPPPAWAQANAQALVIVVGDREKSVEALSDEELDAAEAQLQEERDRLDKGKA